MNPYAETTTTNLPTSRPYVDPHASGEVDPEQYPQPIDSTKKIRGKTELVEMVVGGLQKELIIAKGFYFFFFSAFGSLFPLMGIFFKQHGFSPAQTGILTGIRPLIEYISAPLILQFAERQRKTRILLIASCLSWILFTFPLGSLMPEPVACLYKVNDSQVELRNPEMGPGFVYGGRVRREADGGYYRNVDNLDDVLLDNNGNAINYHGNSKNFDAEGQHLDGNQGNDVNSQVIEANAYEQQSDDDLITTEDTEQQPKKVLRRTKRYIRFVIPGKSPQPVDNAKYYDKTKAKNWVNPVSSTMVFEKDSVAKAFILMLLLIIMGEGLSSPAILLADGTVLHILGDEASARYGHQRMFGSIGWGIAMFFMGIALDHSTFPSRKCIASPQEKNYTVCFAIFVVLMGLATLLAWQLQLYEPQQPTIDIQLDPSNEYTTNIDLNDEKQQTTGTANAAETSCHNATVFAQTNRSLPEWVIVFKHFKTPNCIAFLLVAWIMGVGMGLIFSFLFWHLQDCGGSPILFGLASVINHISEIFAYFFAPTLITQFGHVKVLCLGLLCNVLRFMYISLLNNPWWVLPFEFVQGLTHATVWAACCSYLTYNTPEHLRHPAQSVLQFLHHGLGRGFGAIVGGILISSMGTIKVFRLYGLLCAIGLGLFGFMNFYRKDQAGIGLAGYDEHDPHMMVGDEGGYGLAAPHGVPGGGGGQGGLSRVGSNSKLEGMGDTGQQQVGGGGFNPFGGGGGGGQQQQDQQQYFIR